MRILIVSDIHSNLAALEAVIEHAHADGPIDGVWNTGDSVGYGPQPSRCLARLQELGAVSVAGNHDFAAAGVIGTEEFNPSAATAAKWTGTQLTAAEKALLAGWPEVLRLSASGKPAAEFTLVHGTLREPIWEYLYSYEAAAAHLELQETPFGLVGHTHVPMVVVEDDSQPLGCELYRLGDGETVTLSDARIVINPGSVGQPRDGDPRASYAIYDANAGTVTLRRAPYDIALTQRLMEAEGLPRPLIERLSAGR